MSLRTLMYLLKWLNKDIRALPMNSKSFRIKVRQVKVLTSKVKEIQRIMNQQMMGRINHPWTN